ncbi:MAG TPA: T9SS type A sorting domain-containing protein, partial [Draconibacterium sp.]|nr:T9SS type A sorting domain-containing protein [Draconibacterium sp.]
TYSNYFADWGNGAYDGDLPWQNSSETCLGSIETDLMGPNPIDYDTVVWYNEQCHNSGTDSIGTGQIHLSGITGGVKPYTVWVEGPDAYRPSNGGIGEEITLADTATSYIWDDLVWGHYTVYIKDAKDCELVKESGEIENPDSLQIVRTELVENALCYGGKGTIQIDAIGGVPPYTYAVDSALIPNDGSHPIPYDDLVWQASDTFQVTHATWVAWVKDANGCIVGYATDSHGAPIMQHRVTVLQPDPVVADELDQEGATCYASNTGTIMIGSVDGGNGGDWQVHVSGTDYDGNAVSKWYTGIDTDSDIELDSLYASTNRTDVGNVGSWPASEFYTVEVYDNSGCVSEAYQQYVLQPEPFVVQLEDKNNSFVCPNDKAGLFEIKVVSGGTPYEPAGNFEYMWEAYTDAAMTQKVDSLTGNWGFTSTYLGYGDLYYHVMARDANGCTAEADTFVNAPDPITFDLYQASCYGDTLASVRVIANSPEGRQVRVWYKEVLGNVGDVWKMYDGWFTDTLDIVQVFKFDNENTIDRHYAFKLEDEMGCMTSTDTLTFDEVQHPLTIDDVMVDSVGECASTITVAGGGGIPPYTLWVDGAEMNGMTATIAGGMHEIMVTDAHVRCEAIDTIDVETNPVVRDTTVNTYIGEMVAFSDTEAGLVDTMLVEDSTYVFTYMVGDCERTLNVSVVGVPYEVALADVQTPVAADNDTSAMLGKVVQFTGTVTDVIDGVGFFAQDDNAAWSGIFVSTTEATGLAIGDGVEVMGTVDEIEGVTTIVDATITPVDPPLTIEPLEVASPSASADEMYESVLIKLSGVRANAADTTTGQWIVYTEPTDTAVINDWLFASADSVVEGDFYDVTGIINGVQDAYTTEPRMGADIVNLTKTTDTRIIEDVQFKVYPNPFNDRIMIDNNDKLTRVVISNIAGQRVIDMEYPSHEIRTDNLVSGVYVVSMFTEDGIAKTERIVKR